MKVSVLLTADDEMRFNAYCEKKGYKKSTLIVRLIREHLDREQFAMQRNMFPSFAEKTIVERT